VRVELVTALFLFSLSWRWFWWLLLLWLLSLGCSRPLDGYNWLTTISLFGISKLLVDILQRAAKEEVVDGRGLLNSLLTLVDVETDKILIPHSWLLKDMNQHEYDQYHASNFELMKLLSQSLARCFFLFQLKLPLSN